MMWCAMLDGANCQVVEVVSGPQPVIEIVQSEVVVIEVSQIIAGSGVAIDDSTTSASTVWSSSKTVAAIPATSDAAVVGLLNDSSTATSSKLLATIVAVGPAASDARASRFDIRDHGAVCDGVLATVATTSGSAVITRASGTFSASDVGKTIAVRGAGPVVTTVIDGTSALGYGNDGVWLSTITAASGTTATLATTATSTVAAAECVYGTPDDAAISAAQDAAASLSAFSAAGGSVYFPARVHTIVTQPLTVKDYVVWEGAGKELSHVWILRDGLNWLNAPGTPLSGFEARRFSIHCWAFFYSAGYTPSIKPLNIHDQKVAICTEMAIYDSPATALPFDHSYTQTTISLNLIVNPGRLCASGFGPGGSGIGLGTSGAESMEPSLVWGNTIIGNHTATEAGVGNCGIFIEKQPEIRPARTLSSGYRIIGNTIMGMPVGIAEDGANGSIIAQNIVYGCGQNIVVGLGAVGGAQPGRDTIIAQNDISNATGPGTEDGIGILLTTNRVYTGDLYSVIRTMIRDNVIVGNAKWGILSETGNVEINGVTIRGNGIRGNGLSGIRLRQGSVGSSTRAMRWLAITDNHISSNGTALVHGDAYGIYSTLNLYNHRIQDNDLYNDGMSASTQQNNVYLAGTTNSGGVVDGNVTPVIDVLADTASVAAAAMSGAALPNGTTTTKTWSLAGSGVWSYTGTQMKPTAGSTTLVLADASGLGVNGLYGAVHATVGALAASSQFGGVVARATDTANYVRFATEIATGHWQLLAVVAGAQTFLYTSSILAVAGDVIRMEVDDPYIRVYLNGTLLQQVDATTVLASLTGTKWGMVGSFTVDPTTTLDNFGWTNAYRAAS